MIVSVLVEISHKKIDKLFDYKVKDEDKDKIKIGIRVKVPFGKMILEGFVLDIKENNEEQEVEEEYTLKEIIEIVDEEPLLNKELLELGKIIKQNTMSTQISAYQSMLPSGYKARIKKQVKEKIVVKIKIKDKIDTTKLKLSDKQKEIIDEINKGNDLYTDLKKINSSVDTLLKNNIVEKEEVEVYRLKEKESSYERKVLTKEQQEVADTIINNLNNYKDYLLYGVTGSGKTEVYMEVIDEVLKQGKEVIVLLPEISLTPQIVDRFRGRFKEKISILHSGLSDGEKYDEYKRIRRKETKIVIGARSAIFAPFENIGLVIVDECHSSTYKQDVMPRYDAIEVARIRAKYYNVPLIMGSATPTLDQFARAKKGLYQLLTLKNRIGNAKLPKVEIIDMTREIRVKGTDLSQTLVNKIQEKLERQEQVILFLNRRGYSNMFLCKDCGEIKKCPYCDIPMIYHKSNDMLRCHYCGLQIPKPTKCTECNSENIKLIGTGTEKVEEYITSLFKDYKIARMDLDTTSRKGSHEKIIEDFGNHKYDILLGTQMISKGLDFPNVTLVGVINADTMLAVPSYNSSFEAYSILFQVSGRAGRSDKNGEVIIQTYNKDHYAISSLINNNYEDFYQEEMKIRKSNQYPPFYYLVNIVIKSENNIKLSEEANKISRKLNNELKNSIIFEPNPCYPYKLNKDFRLSILIKYQKEPNLYSVLNEINEYYTNTDKVRVEFAFNPINI